MRDVKEWELLVMVVGKVVIAVMLAAAVVYSMVKGIPISDEMLRWLFLVLAGCMGISAVVSGKGWLSVRKRGRGG